MEKIKLKKKLLSLLLTNLVLINMTNCNVINAMTEQTPTGTSDIMLEEVPNDLKKIFDYKDIHAIDRVEWVWKKLSVLKALYASIKKFPEDKLKEKQTLFDIKNLWMKNLNNEYPWLERYCFFDSDYEFLISCIKKIYPTEQFDNLDAAATPTGDINSEKESEVISDDSKLISNFKFFVLDTAVLFFLGLDVYLIGNYIRNF